jgi:glycine/D-amino acid oxidase-like deaminating enzyme/nitrite reductase/ring-hydroxylating ferredoxin subunit
MALLPGKPEALWVETAPRPRYPVLKGDLSVDVAVLGAGIVGLTTALLLAREGKRVALIEAGRVGMGATAHATVKVTAGHRLLYSRLERAFGMDTARTYAEANLAGLGRVAALVAELDIDCDFERKPNYVFAENATDLGSIEREVGVEVDAGLPSSFVEELDLPFPVAGAVRMEDQAQFHPRRYLLGLAAALAEDGTPVVERTPGLAVHEGRHGCRVETERGEVTADDVVLATQFPFVNRGLLFAKAYAYTEYAVAARIDADLAPQGMFINAGSPTRSFRTAPYRGGLVLIVVGEGHKSGEATRTEERYGALEEWARDNFGVVEFTLRWSTEDYHSMDGLPFVGRISYFSHHVWVATAFGAWGITNGTVAAMVLTDLIAGRENPWAKLFDPQRVTPRQSARRFLIENTKAGIHWVGDRLVPRPSDTEAIQPGDGAVINVDGDEIAAYRDEEGTLHAVSAVCTHIGCIVQWNGAEKTWDCPCHGSRFDVEGKVLHPPAVRPLEKREP